MSTEPALQPSPQKSRLDAFVDAAFAFAVTLLVIADGEAPASVAELQQAMRDLPVFLVSFSLLGMFWFAHVQWRRLGGEDDTLSVLLSFVLVFLVLVYVYPLQMMAHSMTGRGEAGAVLSRRDLASLFTIYGFGFAAMSATVTALFWRGWRHRRTADAQRQSLLGSWMIWAFVTGCGLLSASLSLFLVTAPFAPWVYTVLPLAIAVFAARFDWAGSGRAAPGSACPEQGVPRR